MIFDERVGKYATNTNSLTREHARL